MRDSRQIKRLTEQRDRWLNRAETAGHPDVYRTHMRVVKEIQQEITDLRIKRHRRRRTIRSIVLHLAALVGIIAFLWGFVTLFIIVAQG